MILLHHDQVHKVIGVGKVRAFPLHNGGAVVQTHIRKMDPRRGNVFRIRIEPVNNVPVVTLKRSRQPSISAFIMHDESAANATPLQYPAGQPLRAPE